MKRSKPMWGNNASMGFASDYTAGEVKALAVAVCQLQVERKTMIQRMKKAIPDALAALAICLMMLLASYCWWQGVDQEAAYRQAEVTR